MEYPTGTSTVLSPTLEDITIAKLLNLKGYPHAELFEGVTYPWEVLPLLPGYLEKTIEKVEKGKRNKGKVVGSVYID